MVSVDDVPAEVLAKEKAIEMEKEDIKSKPENMRWARRAGQLAGGRAGGRAGACRAALRSSVGLPRCGLHCRLLWVQAVPAGSRRAARTRPHLR